ncbi:MAG: 30S ribosomal protein S6 [Patescibacteria group bacterium]
MKKYELLLTLPGTFDEKEAEQHVQEILDIIKAGAQDVEINNLGKIRLAYPIKQIRYGYFYTVVFNAESEVVKNIEEKLSLRTDVLRSMVSYFKTSLTATKKIMYSTNEVGVTTMKEMDERVGAGSAAESDKKVNLKDIDTKLNEILDEV